MLFEKFVKQHRVHRVVAHGVDLAVLVAHNQIGIHIGYFFGDQAKLRRPASVALVMERHRLERQDGFAGTVHRFDFVFETPRRADRAELTGRVDQDWYGVGICGCNSTNVADKAAVAHVRTIGADSNNVIGPGDAEASQNPQGNVATTGGVTKERITTDGRVVAACDVAKKRIATNRRVGAAYGIE